MSLPPSEQDGPEPWRPEDVYERLSQEGRRIWDAMDEQEFQIAGKHPLLHSGEPSDTIKRTRFGDSPDLSNVYQLEATPGAQWLTREILRSKPSVDESQVDRLWDRASQLFAQQARGEAYAAVVDSRVESTFRRVELQELVKNQEVTHINGLPRKLLSRLSKSQQLAKVQEASQQIDRDGIDRIAMERTTLQQQPELERGR